MTNTSKPRVLVAMSGGVDSAVAAYLLQQQGFECIGVTLQLFDGFTEVNDARNVAKRLGIPHYTFNLADEFDRQVVRRFADGYVNGLTPNPCIDCNRHIKFGALWQKAQELNAAHLATGHYARVETDPATGFSVLMKAADHDKDQSYVLYSLTQARLGQVLFPLGALQKQAVRDIARAQGFENAEKRESQDICFVPDGNHAAFIERYTGVPPDEGDFIDAAGQILGRHKGLTRYTVGQRKGLGLVLHTPAYVLRKDAETNTVTVGSEQDLYAHTLRVTDFNWISHDGKDGPFRASVRTRYRQAEQGALITPETPDTVTITFDTPQRAPAPGQAAVLYDGETVIGGGTIV